MRYAILVSGGGTTAEQIIQACYMPDGLLNGLVEPACLIVSKAKIPAIKRAIDAGMPKKHIYICDPKDFTSPIQFGDELLRIFRQEKIDWFGQHGWLPKTPEKVVKEFFGINQHPGPVPYFGGQGMYGIRVHAAVLNYYHLARRCSTYTEAVAQLVAKDYDKGQVIVSLPVEIYDDDTPETLQNRVLPIEHLAQILAIRKIAITGGALPSCSSPYPCVRYLVQSDQDNLAIAKRQAIAKYP